MDGVWFAEAPAATCLACSITPAGNSARIASSVVSGCSADWTA